jgi:predicted transcriptional regulator
MADDTPNEFTTLTVQLLSAFVSNNSVSSDGLAELIKSTRAALAESPASNTPEKPAPTFTPAVSVRKSLASADFILSLIDGKPYKTLKRHLAQHGMTPEQYRDRYKLSQSYPMVAPAYSDARRAVAEKLGLGKRPAAVAAKANEGVARKKAVSAVEAAVPGVAPTSEKAAAEAGQGKASKAKSASSPAKKAAGPSPAKPEAKNPAAAAKASRNRLSIAAPKDAKSAPAAKAVAERQAGLGLVETAPAKTKGAPRKSAAADAVKPKASGKPKSLKPAMKAASAHLKAEGDSTEAATTKS